jgi:hypothetical protein
MKVRAIILSAALLSGSAQLASAQTATDINSEASRMNNLASTHGESNVIGKISNDFNSFLGSDAKPVVTGLRNGTPITLTRTTTTPSTTPGGLPVTTTNTTVIQPPTGQMGHGNVYISLALAKQQLSQMGITEPTPQQLQAALTGGTITQTNGTGPTATTTTTKLQGILTMRSEKMGWGKIAQELGTKLGPVMSGMKNANHSLASTSATASKSSGVNNPSGQGRGSSSNGIVSGNGKAQGSAGGNGQSAGKGSSSGIVTASGRSGGGHAYGRGSGTVTGSGHSGGAGGGGVSHGGSGQGGGNGKGHSK